MAKIDDYGWIMPKPTRRERFIRWILRQPQYHFDYTLTFPVAQDLKPGTKIRTSTKGIL